MDIITTIASLGAMGVTVFVIIKVNELLQKEQEKDKPRKSILKEINNFKIFAIAMTLIALGIEVAKHFMDKDNYETVNGIQTNYNELESELDRIKDLNLYSVEEDGDPKAISLTYNNTKYNLSKALPADLKNQLSGGMGPLIINYQNEQYQIQKDKITYGYLLKETLKQNGFFNKIRRPESNSKSKYRYTKQGLNGVWKAVSTFNNSPYVVKVKDKPGVGTIYEISKKNKPDDISFTSENNPSIIDSLNNRPIHFLKGDAFYYMIYLSKSKNSDPYEFEFTQIKLDPVVE